MSVTEPQLHIVHLSSVHNTADVRVFLKECRSLADAGYKVTFVGRGKASDVSNGVNRIVVSDEMPYGRIGRMIFATTRVFRTALNQNADLYHFHGPELIPFGLILKILGKKVIYDAHENYRDQILSKPYLPRMARRPIAIAVGLLEDFAVKYFDGVVAATPRIAKQLQSGNTIWVTNFPISEEIANVESITCKQPGKVVYVGGVEVIRGAREMVSAIDRVNQEIPATLVICGHMDRTLRSELERMPGWKYVDYLGWLDRTETQKHLSTAICGLCVFHPEPNHVEAVPNKLFEYMGRNLPVVSSNFSYWRQFVADIGTGVMVDPLDSQSIADGILTLVGSPERAAQMGESGANAVRDKFNWDLEAEKLVSLYRGVLASENGFSKKFGENDWTR